MQRSIVVVDDHILIAKALTGILERFERYSVLYEVENGKKLVERFQQGRNIPDIVLLDINMPEMDGYETAKWIKENHKDVLILALSMHDEETALIKMIRCGANGYLLKNTHPSDLEKALDSLVEKGYYYPDWLTHKVFSKLSDDRPAKPDYVLNEKEILFLNYAATELTYKEIGDKMDLKPRAVEYYRDGLFEKFGLRTRVGLVIHALRNEIIKL
jgi:DNA-binding NarL/FixJ family response regulator